MLVDPQNRYVNANIFATDGGFVGVIDISTLEAIALFRVTGTNVGGCDSLGLLTSVVSADEIALHVASTRHR